MARMDQREPRPAARLIAMALTAALLACGLPLGEANVAPGGQEGSVGPVPELAAKETSTIAAPTESPTRSAAVNFLPELVHEFPEVGGYGRVRFSPDGSLLAVGTGVEEPGLHLLDATTGEILWNQSHRGGNDLVFTPDGATIAASATQGTDPFIALLEVGSGNEHSRLTGNEPFIRSLAISPDGARIAAGDDETLLLLNLETGGMLFELAGHLESVKSVDFSPQGDLLASGSWDNRVILWDATTAQRLRVLEGHGESVHTVKFSPDGRLLASGGNDNRVLLWDVTSGELMGELEGHEDGVASLAFTPDGRYLASGSIDRRIRIWDVETEEPVDVLFEHADTVWGLSFSPDSSQLASMGNAGMLLLWETGLSPQSP